MISAQEALSHWERKKLITSAKAEELRANLPEHHAHDQTSRAIQIFSAVGAVLIGLGVILFVASNWNGMATLFKLALLIAGTIGTAVAGYMMLYEPGKYPKTGLALLFVNVFIFGASIFLVGQIFHLPLDFSLGSFLWFIATLYFAYAMTSRLHLWLAVPLMLLTIGWFWSKHSGIGSEFDFLTDSNHSILSLLPLIGMGLIATSTLHEREKYLKFGARTLLHWGLFLILLPLVLATVDRTLFFGFFTPPIDAFVLVVMVLVFIALIGSLLAGHFATSQGKAGVIALFLFLAFASALSLVPQFFGIDVHASYIMEQSLQTTMFTALYVLFILLTFAFLFLVIWYGTLLQSTVFVNLGMIGLAFAIIIQYFSWAFAQLDRSIAFILGGILILAVSAILEKQRRKIVASFEHATV
jgi:uncharacterized membrane protein